VTGVLAGPWYELKTIIARHPTIALPLERARGHGEVTRDDTDVVIESFPRCASSFAVEAFRLAQEPRAMRVANHTHMPAVVIDGVRRSIPTLVLIRRADDAVISHLIRNPDLPPRAAVRGYLRFYEPLLPHRHGFTVATFEEITTDFGAVIRRLNAEAGTAFVEFRHTPDNVARIDQKIEVDYRELASSEEQLERMIPRPSGTRDRLKDEVGQRVERDVPPSMLARADEVFRALVG
jgi:hypothetical protein